MIDIFPKYELCCIMLLAILNATIKQTFTPNVALSSTILHQHVHDSSHMSQEPGAKQPWKWGITAPTFRQWTKPPHIAAEYIWYPVVFHHLKPCLLAPWPRYWGKATQMSQFVGDFYWNLCHTCPHLSQRNMSSNHGAFQGRTMNDFSTKDPHGGWVLFPSYVGLQSPHFGAEKLHKGTRWTTCCLADTW